MKKLAYYASAAALVATFALPISNVSASTGGDYEPKPSEVEIVSIADRIKMAEDSLAYWEARVEELETKVEEDKQAIEDAEAELAAAEKAAEDNKAIAEADARTEEEEEKYETAKANVEESENTLKNAQDALDTLITDAENAQKAFDEIKEKADAAAQTVGYANYSALSLAVADQDVPAEKADAVKAISDEYGQEYATKMQEAAKAQKTKEENEDDAKSAVALAKLDLENDQAVLAAFDGTVSADEKAEAESKQAELDKAVEEAEAEKKAAESQLEADKNSLKSAEENADDISDRLESLKADADYTFEFLDETAGQTIARGSELVVRIDANVDTFQGVYVDDVELEEDDYEVSAGSTVVKVTSAYINTLANGKHTLSVVFDNNTVNTTFILADSVSSPDTGSKLTAEAGATASMITAATVATTAAAVFVIRRKANR